ncbi:MULTISPECIES: hypothetical protein [Paraburkholderia]|uniref:hypothetical protein n=1 Tax=Paraburkholderia TaxID=1822464 RepID=UPI000FFCBA7B|nr:MULTISPECIES: hypothetical protein [Paraburkholderia]MBK3778824.1 hypothetical protein [Paraburkholderia aspalathi]MBK5148619.1 hypothetical protein [Burkholderia sp. R-69608]
MANKLMFWPAIKVVVLTVVFVAGLSVQPVANMPFESWVFLGGLAGAMGFFLALCALLLNHLFWPKAKKWRLPGWSNGLLSPWQLIDFYSTVLLVVVASSGLSLWAKHGWREATLALFPFGMACGIWIGVRLGIVIFKSRMPAPS